MASFVTHPLLTQPRAEVYKGNGSPFFFTTLIPTFILTFIPTFIPTSIPTLISTLIPTPTYTPMSNTSTTPPIAITTKPLDLLGSFSIIKGSTITVSIVSLSNSNVV